MGAIKEAILARAIQEFLKKFPGLTLDTLRDGWLPVTMAVIEPRVVEAIKASDHRIEHAEISIADDRLRFDVDTKASVVKNRISCAARIETFELGKQRRHAAFCCNDQVVVEGRNLMGFILRYFVGRAVVSMLNPEPAEPCSASADSPSPAYAIQWPMVTINMDMIPEVQKIASVSCFHVGLFDLIEFGPARLAPNRLEIKVQPVGLLKTVLPEIQKAHKTVRTSIDQSQRGDGAS